MKNICVLQHTEAEYLGLMEDHFEGRNIRFHYRRPFTAGGTIPKSARKFDGLILLGGGPYGLESGHLLPSLGPELRLTKLFLDEGLPVVGFELGAILLAIAAGGGVAEAPLRFFVDRAKRTQPDALGGHLPAEFALAAYLRDRPVLPAKAEVLATGADDEALVFAIGDNCVGFIGHPGMKSGMCEDLIMEFAETPPDTAETLGQLRAAQGEIAEALSEIMVGLVKQTGLLSRACS
jgi:GMP synthase-like glutamine amidotransferase